jgi:ribonuclease HI
LNSSEECTLKTAKYAQVKIFSDGASRGNPGPSAVAFLILRLDNKPLKRYTRFIGTGTNNQAEYKALIRALEAASDVTEGDLTCYLDSELVVKQLNGKYKVRNPVLRGLSGKVNRTRERFRTVSFKHVPRTNIYIREVDKMVNAKLDEVQKRL